MKLYTADKETGTFIEEVETLQEGLELIKKYIEEDTKNGDGSIEYDIVNEHHESISDYIMEVI